MRRQHGFWGAIIFSISFFVASFGTQAAILETVFTENWESGQGDWDVSNGIWQVGTPTSGPGSCYQGTGCAATNLSGNYPNNTDSRINRPTFSPIVLPTVTGMEEIRLRYWQWFSYADDAGVVQVSVFDPVGGWSTWQSVDEIISGASGVWSRRDVDLTEYAGQTIRIGFFHNAEVNTESSGWYLDDVSVIKLFPEFTGDFEGQFAGDIEGGWGDWSASNGIWEIGEDAAFCYQGNQCFGTVFSGNYPNNTDSRLVSAPIQLDGITGMEEIRLRYWQWFSYADDAGVVQVSVFDPVGGWSTWQSVDEIISGASGVWSRRDVDLTEYAGQTIRIGFFHNAEVNTESSGWYLDDVSVIKLFPEFTGDFEGQFAGDIEGGWGDWSASNGIWEIGEDAAFCYQGNQCFGTVFSGNYPNNTDSRLVSAPIQLDGITGMEEIRLRYWQWFSYADDAGVVQVSVFDPVDGWSAWQSIDEIIRGASGVWSRRDVDLTEYAGQKIRIGFFHNAEVNTESSGWYLDEVSVIKKVPEFYIDMNSGIEYGDLEGAFPGDIQGGWGDWSASNGIWEIGTPTAGPGGCNSGMQCAGTVLGGNYPNNTDSRLISPTVKLPSGGANIMSTLVLRYWEWFSYADDAGVVQVSVLDPVDGWSTWTNISSVKIGSSSGWSSTAVDLNAYAGQTLRIGFFHNAEVNTESSGWFIDDIRLPGVFGRPCEGDFDNDGDVDNSNIGPLNEDFARRNCSLQDFCVADFNQDGDVDNSDVAVFSGNFGENMCFELDPFSD